MKTVHYHFDSISSTNDVGKIFLTLLNSSTMAVLSAAEQIRGRGQYGKRWFAPKGTSLLASFCFLLEEHLACPPALTQMFALITTQVLKEKMGLACSVKLPNDVFFAKKKLAGILCETKPVDSHGFIGIVLGIGLNVNATPSMLASVGQPATSIFVETKKEWLISEILDDLTSHFLLELQNYRISGFQNFHNQFKVS